MIINMAGGSPTIGAVKKGTIAVSYPAGDHCVVKGNNREYPALNTNGSAGFVVKAGTWTVSAGAPGGVEVSKEIAVEDGKAYFVELRHTLMLYDKGTEYVPWVTNGTKTNDGISIVSTTYASSYAKTESLVDVSDYKKLYVTISNGGFTQIGSTKSHSATIQLLDADGQELKAKDFAIGGESMIGTWEFDVSAIDQCQIQCSVVCGVWDGQSFGNSRMTIATVRAEAE